MLSYDNNLRKTMYLVLDGGSHLATTDDNKGAQLLYLPQIHFPQIQHRYLGTAGLASGGIVILKCH